MSDHELTVAEYGVSPRSDLLLARVTVGNGLLFAWRPDPRRFWLRVLSLE